MKFFKPILLFLLLVSIYDCTYNFEPDHFLNIEEVNANDSTIEILNFKNYDTINISRTFEYVFNLKEFQNTVSYRVFLDGEEIASSLNSKKKEFTLKPERYEDGSHNLRIEHTFTSGSKSIKDQIQEELLTKKALFNFIVKRNPANPPAIENVAIENGSIVVKWLNPSNDFESAYLSIKTKNFERKIPLSQDQINAQQYIDTSSVLIESPSNNLYFDEISKLNYSLVYTTEFEEITGNSKSISFNPDWFNVKISYVDSEHIKVIWNQYPLYKNAKNLTIAVNNNVFEGSALGGEKIINQPYVLGKEFLTTIKLPNRSQYFLIANTPVVPETFKYIDIKNLVIENLMYNSFNSKYYALVIENNNSTYLYEYSDSLEFVKKLFIANEKPRAFFGLNPTFEYNKKNGNIYIETFYSSFEVDISNYSIKSEYKTTNSTVVPTFRENILYSYDVGSYKLYLEIKNIETDKIIYSDKIKAAENVFLLNPGAMSGNGKYVYIPNYETRVGSVYEIKNDQLELIHQFTTTSKFKFYDNEFIYKNDDNVTIVNLEKNTSTSFKSSFFNIQNYDANNQKVLLLNSDNGEIYDLTSQTSKTFDFISRGTGQIRTRNNKEHKVFLINNRLIHTSGAYIEDYK